MTTLKSSAAMAHLLVHRAPEHAPEKYRGDPRCERHGYLVNSCEKISELAALPDHNMASTTTTPVEHRPIFTNAASGVSGPRRFTDVLGCQRGRLFKAAWIVLIRAASSPAAIRPRTPVGSSSFIMTISVASLSFPICFRNST